MEKEWVVYMIRNENGSLYTGITTDIKRRLQEHQSGKKGAKFFHLAAALQLEYQEPALNRSEASKREAAIKKLSKVIKEQMILDYQKKKKEKKCITLEKKKLRPLKE